MAKRKKAAKRRRKTATKRSAPKASLSVAKRISTVGRKRCGNPDRQKEVMNIARYIAEVGRVERELGPTVRPISQVKRNIKAMQKTALRLVRVGRKCAGKAAAATPEHKRLYRG